MNEPEDFSPKQRCNKRQNREGNWAPYKALREYLKAAGVNQSLAWQVTCHLYPPKDGSPPEAPLTPILEALIEKFRDKVGNIPPLEKVPGKPITNYRPTKAQVTPEIQEVADEVNALPARMEKGWAALRKKVDANRCVGNLVDWMIWLYQHYGCEPQEIDPATVPCRGVINDLRQLNVNPASYSKFLDFRLSKLIPNRNQLETGHKFSDDNRELFELFSDFENSLDAEEQEAA